MIFFYEISIYFKYIYFKCLRIHFFRYNDKSTGSTLYVSVQYGSTHGQRAHNSSLNIIGLWHHVMLPPRATMQGGVQNAFFKL